MSADARLTHRSPMSRYVTPFAIAIIAIVSPVAAQVSRPQAGLDPVFVRAQQMITAGHDSAGRAVLDSVLAAAPEGTSRYAEALFWRGRFNKTSAGAERDYRRLVVEYALSPRAAESLLLLAQLEMTRRDRVSARMHLERLQREHPGSSVSTRGSVMLAQLAFNDGDDAVGCSAVAAAKESVSATDVEVRNQLDYYNTRCSNVAARQAARDSAATTPPAAAPTPSDPAASSDSATPRSTASERAAAGGGGGGGRVTREFSVQVAAYGTRAEAEAHAKRLSGWGYNARVVGGARPFRVRVGRYASRDRAESARRQVGGRAIVVEAEPR
jgi:cell division septation protein DedD